MTRCGNTELDKPIAIRPTSETVMYPYFSQVWNRVWRGDEDIEISAFPHNWLPPHQEFIDGGTLKALVCRQMEDRWKDLYRTQV